MNRLAMMTTGRHRSAFASGTSGWQLRLRSMGQQLPEVTRRLDESQVELGAICGTNFGTVTQ